MAFNMFDVLGKDDKELIHSAFLKFLISEYPEVLQDFFELESTKKFKEPTLECLYTFTRTVKTKEGQVSEKKQRCRMDLELQSQDGEEIIVIENKFKSIPTQKQLENIESAYKIKHPGKNLHKYLISFDPNIHISQNDWKFLHYGQLVNHLEKYMGDGTSEKEIFIRHYKESLETYTNKHKRIRENCAPIFAGKKIKMNEDAGEENLPGKERNFWLNIIYSELQRKLEQHFKDKVSYRLSPGNTSTSLLNIIPEGWKIKEKELSDGWQIKEKELLIQIQGEKIKFYSHTNIPEFIEPIINRITDKTFSKVDGYNKKTSINRKEKTRYLVQISVHKALGKSFTIDDLFHFILDFYRTVDLAVMRPELLEREQKKSTKTPVIEPVS